MPPFQASILECLRISLGDYNFDVIENVTAEEANVFWAVWVVIFFFSGLIFLNFIIAEVGSSYETINEDIDALIYKSRATMIMEVEDFK